MSSTIGAILLTVSLAASTTATDRLAVPKLVLESGLKKANCTIPPHEAAVIGTEHLSARLAIVEVTCWRDATNAGSILFAVPEEHPQGARLIMLENWRDGRVGPTYSVSSPGYDAKTRTLNSNHQTRSAGDCGTIKEWKWTGWHFRLLNAWRKDRCDGEPFEWDSRDKWQVFPHRGLEPDRDGAGTTQESSDVARLP